MSKDNNSKEGRFEKFLKKYLPAFSKKDHDGNIRSESISISPPIPTKRKHQKQNAPQPPTKRTKESSSIEIEQTNEDFSNLNIRQNNNSSSQIVSLPPNQASLEYFQIENENKRGESSKSGKQHNKNQNTIKNDQVQNNLKNGITGNTLPKNLDNRKVGESERSKLNIRQQNHASPERFQKENEIKRGESSKSEKQHTKNQNTVRNDQVQNNSKNDNIGNTKSKILDNKKVCDPIIPESEPARAENEFQKSSRNKQSTIEIKNSGGEPSDRMVNDVKCIPSQILEDATCTLENERFNSPKGDNTNKSLSKCIENKDEVEKALKQINSVMEEVNNVKLDMQNLNNPQESYIFESILTNAMIKLDSIQMSKNELIKEKRKKGILFIQEVFSLLDEQQAEENLK